MKPNTEHLIRQLTADATPIRPMPTPLRRIRKLSAWLLLYAIATAMIQGLRPDLGEKFSNPMYLVELICLVAMIGSSLTAAVHLTYPDRYQQRDVLVWPGIAVLIFWVLTSISVFVPSTQLLTVPEATHELNCVMCVIGVAILPSAVMFAVAKRGATVNPSLLGAYAMLAAAALGCLLLRLVEANDAPMHLLVWHTGPMVMLAALGTFLGKKLLRW